EMRAANETLRTVIEASPQAIILLDMESRIRLWNRAAEQVFGWKAEEVIGEDLPYIPEDKLEEHHQLFNRAAAGETINNFETRRRTRGGRPIDMLLSVVPLRDAQGAVSTILMVVTDITERKRFENQLFRIQRLESIGMLASGIAHDLNNILAPILMAIQLFR